MTTGTLGRIYSDGEVIIHQGESGDCMYVIQSGEVEVIQGQGDSEIRLATIGEGDFFGEMSIFQKEERSATVRALGEVRILTVDKTNFLRRVHADPSLAFRLVETLSKRIREMNSELARIKNGQ